MPSKAAAQAQSAASVARAPQKGDHVFLVDGSSYIFRAYHALPPLNRKSDGLQVNAVLGFCNMLWKLLRDMKPEERPTHLAVVFDKSEKTFRNEMYADYKAHRPQPPDDLRPQFAFLREAVRAFDIPCLEQLGYEADDLIATYVRETCELGATATIVASDKDLMQLVNDCVVMYDTMKDRRIGISEVIEKFGVPPEKLVEVQALMGDSSDNVPGVPGIGVKTAAQLIGEYGDLESLLARAIEIKQEKRRQSLIEFAEQARMSKRLVLLDDHVELKCPLEDLPLDGRDAKTLIAFLKAMEFTNLTKRVGEAMGIDPNAIDPDPALRADLPEATTAEPAPAPAVGEAAPAAAATTSARQLSLALPPVASDRKRAASLRSEATAPLGLVRQRLGEISGRKIDRTDYQTIRDVDTLGQWIAHATDRGVVAVDLVTTSADPMAAALIGVSLALAPNRAAYVPLRNRDANDLLAGGGLPARQVPH